MNEERADFPRYAEYYVFFNSKKIRKKLFQAEK